MPYMCKALLLTTESVAKHLTLIIQPKALITQTELEYASGIVYIFKKAIE